MIAIQIGLLITALCLALLSARQRVTQRKIESHVAAVREAVDRSERAQSKLSDGLSTFHNSLGILLAESETEPEKRELNTTQGTLLGLIEKMILEYPEGHLELHYGNKFARVDHWPSGYDRYLSRYQVRGHLHSIERGQHKAELQSA